MIFVCDHDLSLLEYHNGDCGDGAPRIHALVIGVSEYASPRRALTRTPFASLPGSALAAGRFARYLIDEFRDPEGRLIGTVRLLVSPDKNSAYEESELYGELGLKQRNPALTATTDEAGMALQDWANDCDGNEQNLAILYVAGHGVALGSGASTLFLADAMQRGNKYQGSINLTAVAQQMAFCSAKDNIYLYDCCALDAGKVPDMGAAGSGVSIDVSLFPNPVEIDENHEPKKRRSTDVYISAARIGTSTYAIGELGTLLSRGLLGLFKKRVGEDALLRTSGEIVDQRYGITVQRLRTDLKPRLVDLIHELGEEPKGYEPAVTVGAGPARALAVPAPPPAFPVVLKGLQQGRPRPVTLAVRGPQGVVCNLPDAPDEYQLPDCPAGEYHAYVGTSVPYPIPVDRPLIMDLSQGV